MIERRALSILAALAFALLTLSATGCASSSEYVVSGTDKAAGVSESGKPAAQAEGVAFLRMEGGQAVYQIGSGRYVFRSTMAQGDT